MDGDDTSSKGSNEPDSLFKVYRAGLSVSIDTCIFLSIFTEVSFFSFSIRKQSSVFKFCRESVKQSCCFTQVSSSMPQLRLTNSSKVSTLLTVFSSPSRKMHLWYRHEFRVRWSRRQDKTTLTWDTRQAGGGNRRRGE